MKHAYLSGNTTFEIQQALNRLVDQFSSSTINNVSGSCFVFQPGGTDGGNVYTDWSVLVLAASLVEGIKTVYFDNTYGQCDIPNGQWSLGGYTIFHGMQPGVNDLVILNFLDGASINGVYEFRFLNIFANSTVDDIEHIVIKQSPNQYESVYILANHSKINNNGVAPFYGLDLGLKSAIWMIMDDCIVITGLGRTPAPVFKAISRNSRLSVFAFDNSDVQDYTISNLPNTTVDLRIINSAANISVNQLFGINPVIAAVVLSELSSREFYDTTNPANWKTNTPANVTEALDRIATELVSLLGHPIG